MVDAVHGLCAGAGGLQWCGGQPHLWGITYCWVTPTEFWGSPNRSLPPTMLGRGSSQAVRQWCCADVAVLQGWSLLLFPLAHLDLLTVGGAFGQPGAVRRREQGERSAGTRPCSLLAPVLACCHPGAQPGGCRSEELQREGEKLASSLPWLLRSCVPAGSLPAASWGSSAYF